MLPQRARCVVIGGGVIGASTAYHLSKLGWSDIHILEQAAVTSGTTWHAAGLVGTTRNSAAETALSLIGVELYGTLLEETGMDPGFKQCGSVNVARTPERMEVLARSAMKARAFGQVRAKLPFVPQSLPSPLSPSASAPLRPAPLHVLTPDTTTLVSPSVLHALSPSLRKRTC